MNHSHEDLGMGTLLSPPKFRVTAKAHRDKRPKRVNKRREEHIPYYRLWASIISQAVIDVEDMVSAIKAGSPVSRYTETKKAYQRRREKYLYALKEGRDALKWMEGEDQGGLAFHDLCTALNLNPGAILERVKVRMQ